MTDDLTQQLREVEAPLALGLPPAGRLVALARRRQRRRRAAGAVLGVTALLGAVPLVTGLPSEPDTVAPLAEPDRTVDGQPARVCGGLGPLSALTAEPGAERADTPEAAGLRRVLAEGIAGMSFPPRDSWVLLGRTGDRVSFAHRTGAAGLDEVVTVEPRDGEYDFSGSGGCGPVGWADGRQAVGFQAFTTDGTRLVLQWSGGTCGDQRPPVVRVVETDQVVSVLQHPQPPLPQEGDGACAGVGTSETTTVELAAPLGERRVEDLAYAPARTVLSAQETQRRAVADSERQARATAACARTARELGGEDEVAYAVDVATVRATVPEADERWTGLGGGAEAAHCYLRTPAGAVWSYVAADGAPTVVVDRAYDRGGLYVQLGDDR